MVSMVFATCLTAAQKDSSLPAPMSSALDRLAHVDRRDDKGMRNLWVRGQQPPFLVLPGPVPKLSLGQCSIPLKEAQVPEKKFFIRQMPVSKDSPDSMPILKGNVCPTTDAK
jgi:hypothetical protein